MKNEITIETSGEDLVSSVDDGTNSLYINDTEIDSSNWVGSGNYTTTVNGYTVTIAKVADLTGNIIINKTGNYTYALEKAVVGYPLMCDADGNVVVPNNLTVGGTVNSVDIEDLYTWAHYTDYSNGIKTNGAHSVKFGDANNTAAINVWGNTTNKVAVSATNNTDNRRYGLLARNNRISLYGYDPNEVIYDIYPFSQSEKTKLAGIGTFNGGISGSTNIANKTLTSGTSVTNLGSISFSAGYYLLIVLVRFQTNATGRRYAEVTQSTESSTVVIAQQTEAPVNGGYTTVRVVRLVGDDSAFTVNVGAYQNSGSDLVAATRYQSIRIA